MEMALVLPLLFLLLFATVEFSRVNMVRNSVKNACFEGARRGSLPGATATDVRVATERILNAIGVRKARIEVFPDVIDSSTKSVIVSVSAPLNENAWITPRFFKNAVIERACRLNREYVNPVDADKPDPLDKVELTLAPKEMSELDEMVTTGVISPAAAKASLASASTSVVATVAEPLVSTGTKSGNGTKGKSGK